MHAEFQQVFYRSLVLAAPPWLRHQKNGRYQLCEGVAFTANDMPGPSFNKVAVFGPSPPLERIVTLAAAFYTGRPGGYGIMVEADARHPVETELQALKWRVEEDEPALVMPSIAEPPSLPDGLEIHLVSDEADLRSFRATATAGFGTPPELADTLAPSLAYTADADIGLLLGVVSGQAVATAVCFRLNDVAWIAGVAVPEPYRNRGYGTALTWAAVFEGARRGCTCAALNSGPMSLQLYQRMGFVLAGNHRTYASPQGG